MGVGREREREGQRWLQGREGESEARVPVCVMIRLLVEERERRKKGAPDGVMQNCDLRSHARSESAMVWLLYNLVGTR